MQTRDIKHHSENILSCARQIAGSIAPLTALLALGCSRGEPQELGFTNDAIEASSDATGVTSRDFFGEWVGMAEDALALSDDADVYHFPSGSSQLRLSIGEVLS